MSRPLPPDQPQRDRALDPTRSVLVQAPAGSGKTTLLAERFLRLLAQVEDPGHVVAITFTNAAAAEMRNRILDQLRSPQPSPHARRVLERSELLGWKLLDLPAQLRISTIDSFCRDLALQQPLLSTPRRRPRHLRPARRPLPPRRPPDTGENGRAQLAPRPVHRVPPPLARQQLAGNRERTRCHARQTRQMDAQLCARTRAPASRPRSPASTPRTPLRQCLPAASH